MSFALSHVGADRCVQLDIGEKVELVVNVEVADETLHVAASVVHVNESARIALSGFRVDRIAAGIERLSIASQLVRTRVYGQSGVERSGSPNGAAVVESVLCERAFGVESELQVVVEEAWVEHDAAGESLRLVAADYTVLVGIAYRSAEGQTLYDVARQRKVVVGRECGAIDFVKPVGIGVAQQSLLGIGAMRIDNRAELFGTQYVHHLGACLHGIG